MHDQPITRRASRFSGLRAMLNGTGSAPARSRNDRPPAATPAKANASRTARAKTSPPAPRNPVAAARAEERKRIADVFASKEVSGREMTAGLLLAETNMSGPAIIGFLTTLEASAAAQERARAAIVDAAANRRGDGPAQNFGWATVHAEIRHDRSI